MNLNGKVLKIHKFDGESYRSGGRWNPGRLSLMLEFKAEGIESGMARLDGFFRGHLGDLDRVTRTAIKRTKPKEVVLSTRTYTDPYGEKSTLYVIHKSIMEAWLDRVEQVLDRIDLERKLNSGSQELVSEK